jgi:hypothetical protein
MLSEPKQFYSARLLTHSASLSSCIFQVHFGIGNSLFVEFELLSAVFKKSSGI